MIKIKQYSEYNIVQCHTISCCSSRTHHSLPGIVTQLFLRISEKGTHAHVEASGICMQYHAVYAFQIPDCPSGNVLHDREQGSDSSCVIVVQYVEFM